MLCRRYFCRTMQKGISQFAYSNSTIIDIMAVVKTPYLGQKTLLLNKGRLALCHLVRQNIFTALDRWTTFQIQRIAYGQVFTWKYNMDKSICEEYHKAMDSMMQVDGGLIIMWDVFCWILQGSLMKLQFLQTGGDYTGLVTDHLHPFMDTIFLG